VAMQLHGRGLCRYSNYSFYRPAVPANHKDLASNLHLRDTIDKITWDEGVNVLEYWWNPSCNDLIA